VKRLLFGFVALGLFVDVAGQARADYIFTTLDVPASAVTQAYGINDATQIGGGYSAGSTNHGFLLSGGSYTTIDPPGSTFTRAVGINNASQIVGLCADASGIERGFLLSGGFTTIAVPGSMFTDAYGIHAVICIPRSRGVQKENTNASTLCRISTARQVCPAVFSRPTSTA
jgi:hypothetical protein